MVESSSVLEKREQLAKIQPYYSKLVDTLFSFKDEPSRKKGDKRFKISYMKADQNKLGNMYKTANNRDAFKKDLDKYFEDSSLKTVTTIVAGILEHKDSLMNEKQLQAYFNQNPKGQDFENSVIEEQPTADKPFRTQHHTFHIATGAQSSDISHGEEDEFHDSHDVEQLQKSLTEGMQQYVKPDEDEQPFQEQSKEEQAKQLLATEEIKKTGLMQDIVLMSKQHNVPQREITESVHDRVELIVRNKRSNPKAMQILGVLIAATMERRQKQVMPPGMQQIRGVKAGTIGSLEESKDLMGTSGVENLKPENSKQSMPIVADKLIETNMPPATHAHLLSIINNPKADPQSKQKAKDMILKYKSISNTHAEIMKHFQPAIKAAEQAKLDIERPQYPLAQNDKDAATDLAVFKGDNGVETEPRQIDTNIRENPIDAIETNATQQIVKMLEENKDLNESQVAMFKRDTLDADGFLMNYDFIREQSKQWGNNPLYKKYAEAARLEMIQKGQPRRPNLPLNPQQIPIAQNLALPPAEQQQQQQQQPKAKKGKKSNKTADEEAYLHTSKMAAGSNIGQSIQHEYATDEGLQGAHKKKRPTHTKMVPTRVVEREARQGNETAKAMITLYDFFNYIGETADYISKIAGDMSNPDLSSYKNQTAIFTTSIVKKETGQFKIAPNSMYKIRDCC